MARSVAPGATLLACAVLVGMLMHGDVLAQTFDAGALFTAISNLGSGITSNNAPLYIYPGADNISAIASVYGQCTACTVADGQFYGSPCGATSGTVNLAGKFVLQNEQTGMFLTANGKGIPSPISFATATGDATQIWTYDANGRIESTYMPGNCIDIAASPASPLYPHNNLIVLNACDPTSRSQEWVNLPKVAASHNGTVASWDNYGVDCLDTTSIKHPKTGGITGALATCSPGAPSQVVSRTLVSEDSISRYYTLQLANGLFISFSKVLQLVTEDVVLNGSHSTWWIYNSRGQFKNANNNGKSLDEVQANCLARVGDNDGSGSSLTIDPTCDKANTKNRWIFFPTVDPVSEACPPAPPSPSPAPPPPSPSPAPPPPSPYPPPPSPSPPSPYPPPPSPSPPPTPPSPPPSPSPPPPSPGPVATSTNYLNTALSNVLSGTSTNAYAPYYIFPYNDQSNFTFLNYNSTNIPYDPKGQFWKPIYPTGLNTTNLNGVFMLQSAGTNTSLVNINGGLYLSPTPVTATPAFLWQYDYVGRLVSVLHNTTCIDIANYANINGLLKQNLTLSTCVSTLRSQQWVNLPEIPVTYNGTISTWYTSSATYPATVPFCFDSISGPSGGISFTKCNTTVPGTPLAGTHQNMNRIVVERTGASTFYNLQFQDFYIGYQAPAKQYADLANKTLNAGSIVYITSPVENNTMSSRWVYNSRGQFKSYLGGMGSQCIQIKGASNMATAGLSIDASCNKTNLNNRFIFFSVY